MFTRPPGRPDSLRLKPLAPLTKRRSHSHPARPSPIHPHILVVTAGWLPVELRKQRVWRHPVHAHAIRLFF